MSDLTDHPTDPKARARLREKRLRVGRADGEQTARRMFASIKCSEHNRHAGELGGCSNDGSTCLCECHDLVVREVSA